MRDPSGRAPRANSTIADEAEDGSGIDWSDGVEEEEESNMEEGEAVFQQTRVPSDVATRTIDPPTATRRTPTERRPGGERQPSNRSRENIGASELSVMFIY